MYVNSNKGTQEQNGVIHKERKDSGGGFLAFK